MSGRPHVADPELGGESPDQKSIHHESFQHQHQFSARPESRSSAQEKAYGRPVSRSGLVPTPEEEARATLATAYRIARAEEAIKHRHELSSSQGVRNKTQQDRADIHKMEMHHALTTYVDDLERRREDLSKRAVTSKMGHLTALAERARQERQFRKARRNFVKGMMQENAEVTVASIVDREIGEASAKAELLAVKASRVREESVRRMLEQQLKIDNEAKLIRPTTNERLRRGMFRQSASPALLHAPPPSRQAANTSGTYPGAGGRPPVEDASVTQSSSQVGIRGLLDRPETRQTNKKRPPSQQKSQQQISRERGRNSIVHRSSRGSVGALPPLPEMRRSQLPPISGDVLSSSDASPSVPQPVEEDPTADPDLPVAASPIMPLNDSRAGFELQDEDDVELRAKEAFDSRLNNSRSGMPKGSIHAQKTAHEQGRLIRAVLKTAEKTHKRYGESTGALPPGSSEGRPQTRRQQQQSSSSPKKGQVVHHKTEQNRALVPFEHAVARMNQKQSGAQVGARAWISMFRDQHDREDQERHLLREAHAEAEYARQQQRNTIPEQPTDAELLEGVPPSRAEQDLLGHASGAGGYEVVPGAAGSSEVVSWRRQQKQDDEFPAPEDGDPFPLAAPNGHVMPGLEDSTTSSDDEDDDSSSSGSSDDEDHGSQQSDVAIQDNGHEAPAAEDGDRKDAAAGKIQRYWRGPGRAQRETRHRRAVSRESNGREELDERVAFASFLSSEDGASTSPALEQQDEDEPVRYETPREKPATPTGGRYNVEDDDPFPPAPNGVMPGLEDSTSSTSPAESSSSAETSETASAVAQAAQPEAADERQEHNNNNDDASKRTESNEEEEPASKSDSTSGARLLLGAVLRLQLFWRGPGRALSALRKRRAEVEDAEGADELDERVAFTQYLSTSSE